MITTRSANRSSRSSAARVEPLSKRENARWVRQQFHFLRVERRADLAIHTSAGQRRPSRAGRSLTIDLSQADYEALRALAEKHQVPLSVIVSEMLQGFLKYR